MSARNGCTNLIEFVKDAQRLTVDRANDVIRNVKVIGFKSDNGREYPRETLEKARPMYEGKKVYANHPDRPGQPRDVEDLIGTLVNVRMAEDGLRADLAYNPKHPLAESLIEDAQKHKGWYGLSHNADGKVERRNGVDVVTEIVHVKSVDLVTEPATNANLWESKTMPKIKISDLFERLTTSAKLPRKTRKRLLEAMDDGDMGVVGTYEMDEPDGDEAPAESLKRGFKEACMGHIHEHFDGDDTSGHAEKAGKIGELMKAHHELTQESEDEPGEPEEADGGKIPAGESRKTPKPRKGTAGITEARVTGLCKLAGVRHDAPLVEGLVAMGDEDKVLRHLEYLKTLSAKGANPPRSGGAAPAEPVTEGTLPKFEKREDVVNFYKNGR